MTAVHQLATRNAQLPVTGTQLAWAAGLLWGEAGMFAANEYEHLNHDVFDDELPALPVVIGLTAYGACLGLTRTVDWTQQPRITLPPEIFNGSPRLRRCGEDGGVRMVRDVLTHEMVHALLMLRGVSPHHNDDPWCETIAALSPTVVGHTIVAHPVRTRRVPNPARESDARAPKSKVVRRAVPGALARRDLARWPHSVRPPHYYDGDRQIRVPTY